MTKPTAIKLVGFSIFFLAAERVVFAGVELPVVLAKVWALGYALVFLGILLGLVPLAWPSRRKAEKKEQ
ncbi:MAG: hypothetical protein QGG36_02945 [Pirellulaceae bacterium]|jgi:hypothetical protein|nr:hypothetical protein [Pirellulaceae bacterium]MDP7014735.1 hypothetical protein [Pirellulaceae bacterium]